MMGIVYTLHALGQWREDRQSNLLDGAMPYYRCYETSDGKYMAVGCIEPQFFALMLDILDINPDEFGGQNNPKHWPAQHKHLETLFMTKSRDDWAALFDGTETRRLLTDAGLDEAAIKNLIENKIVVARD